MIHEYEIENNKESRIKNENKRMTNEIVERIDL
jgi:hypothetical protein